MFEIKIGDKLKCLDCGQIFILDDVLVTPEGEYVGCPHCKEYRDIQHYLIQKMWYGKNYPYYSE